MRNQVKIVLWSFVWTLCMCGSISCYAVDYQFFSDDFQTVNTAWKGAAISYVDEAGDKLARLSSASQTLRAYLQLGPWKDSEIKFKMRINDFGAYNYNGAGCKVGITDSNGYGYEILFRKDNTVTIKDCYGTLLKAFSNIITDVNTWYDVRIQYTPGRIALYRNDNFIGDFFSAVYTEGSFCMVSSRTEAYFNDLEIYRRDILTMENNKVKVSFKRDADTMSTCKLAGFYDRTQNYDYLADVSAAVNLWDAYFFNSSRTQYFISQGTGGSLNASFTTNANNDQILQLKWSSLPINGTADSADIVANFTLKNNSERLESSLNVDLKNNTYGLFKAAFPKISTVTALSDTNSYLAHPYGAGRIANNPHSTGWTNTKYSYSSSNCGLQMFAYYNEAGSKGLYLATEDGDMYMKEYQLNYATPYFSYSLTQYPEPVAALGADYTQTYPQVIQSFNGDYITAAKIYRSWALSQIWCQNGKVYDRTDMGYMRNIDFLLGGECWFSFSPYISLATRWSYSATYLQTYETGIDMTDAENHFSSTATASKFAGTNMIHFSTNWFLEGFDVGYPRFTAANNLSTYISTLLNLGAGIKTMPYVNIRRSYCESEFDWWVNNNGENYAIKAKANNKIMLTMQNNDACVMAPGSSLWNNWFIDKCNELASNPIYAKGIYLDELSAMAPFINYPATGSSGSSGKIWNDDSRTLCQNIKATGKFSSPDFFTCGEQISEIYLDVCDAGLLFGQSKYTDNIPLFAAVYHDYSIPLGKTIGKWSDPYLAASYPVDEQDGTTVQDEFITRLGKIAAMGEGTPFLRGDIVDFAGGQNSSPIISLDRIVKIRNNFDKYLKYGELLDYREGGCTGTSLVNTRWLLAGNLTNVSIQAILSSAWKSVDSSDPLGLFIVNVSTTNRNVTYPLDIKKFGLSSAPTGVMVYIYKGTSLNYTTINQSFSGENYEIDMGTIDGKTPYFCKLYFSY